MIHAGVWRALVGGVMILLSGHLTAGSVPLRVDVPPQLFRGGWKLDVQFMDVMGSPYLLAHGMGRPVTDSSAEVELPSAGVWAVAVRSRNWLPEHAELEPGARHPGSFRVLVNGRPLDAVLGCGARTWSWEIAGTCDLPAGRVRVTLRDDDGFDGRCAGVSFVRGGTIPSDAPALSGSAAEPAVCETFDFVVVGGGVPGCCAAVAAARAGLKTALVQDRPVLGGNSSSEIRVYSAGEQRHPLVKELRSLFLNRDPNFTISDEMRLAKLQREPNLSVYLSHRVFAAQTQSGVIRSARALDLENNRVVAFAAPYFADATGDGWLGYYAGAEFRQGREARAEFGERYAPETADRGTLGSSLMWKSSEANADIPFSAPWAEKYACGETCINGEWNWEYGLDRDVLTEGEAIRDRLLLAIYGAFSRAKRNPDNARRMLTTCPFLLGKRESLRLMGDWIYKEQDIAQNTPFEDAIATGSWSIDLHYVKDPAKPFLTRCEQPHFGRYWIPYRSVYSRNVTNLFLVGRCFSCSHVGLGGPRVICTLAQMGVAVGEAAAMCHARGLSPRGLYETPGAMRELQRKLGGSWPGNPDPAEHGWRIVDDEDAAARFGAGWERERNHNGAQRGGWSTIHHAEAQPAVSPEYTFAAVPSGRYVLKALTPYVYDVVGWEMGRVKLRLRSARGTRELVWNQRVDSGEWHELGRFDLSGDVTLTISPQVENGKTILLDAFALCPCE